MWALCLFALALLLLAEPGRLPASPARAAPCALPREALAERGWTRAVSCAPPPGGGGMLRGPARWLFAQRLDLNAAGGRALEALPGIGPARARDILAERRRGRFRAVDDLVRVHGIGPKTVERLRPFVRVDPPRTREPAEAGTGREG